MSTARHRTDSTWPRGIFASAINSWNRFFFKPQSPLPIALFRIFYGLLVIATLVLLRPDWLSWYGVHSWVTLPTALSLEPGIRLSFFCLIPQNDAWINALFWLSLGSATLLTVGLFTRVDSVLVFVCLNSIQQRNLYITHGGDTFLRAAGFFLMFAPAGAALSIDRLIRLHRGKETASPQLHSPWAQRMIQIQLTFVYLASFLYKIKGRTWLDGTALFYVYHLDELRRLPLPWWFFQPLMLKLGTWFALALEFSLGSLVWMNKLRYPLLVLGVLFHLSIEYSLNVPMFQWEVLSAYILFIDPNDLRLLIRRAPIRAVSATPPTEV